MKQTIWNGRSLYCPETKAELRLTFNLIAPMLDLQCDAWQLGIVFPEKLEQAQNVSDGPWIQCGVPISYRIADPQGGADPLDMHHSGQNTNMLTVLVEIGLTTTFDEDATLAVKLATKSPITLEQLRQVLNENLYRGEEIGEIYEERLLEVLGNAQRKRQEEKRGHG
jgi:hypothetical protein